MFEDLYDPFDLAGEDEFPDDDSSEEQKWDQIHNQFTKPTTRPPSQRPLWWIKSTINAKLGSQELERLKSLNQITSTTISLYQHHVEQQQHINPYPIETDLITEIKSICLFFLMLINPILNWILNMVLKFNPNNYFVLIYTFALEIGSRLLYTPVDVIHFDVNQLQVNFYKWLFCLFFNHYFLFFFCLFCINGFWFSFWFFLFYKHWMNSKCKTCGYNISFNRFNKTKIKDR